MLAWLFAIILVASGENPDFQQTLVPSDTLLQKVDTTGIRILQVGRVIILGNKVTKNRIIERELSLQPGDTISSKRLPGIIQWDKNKLYNLRLFNTVSVRALELDQEHIDLLVEVTERWYIFPVPILELSDRNFNDWWTNYNHDFSRINYGLRLYKYNFRGRNESLRLTAQFGFYKKFDLQYKIPNLDRKQKHGIAFNFDYATPKNLAYRTGNSTKDGQDTLDHVLVFYRDPNEIVVKKSFGAGIGYSYRKSFFETHAFNFNYRESHVIDNILALNPIYYSYNKTSQRYFAASYSFISEHRDVVQYPLKGYQFTGYIAKAGILPGDDVNQLEINITYARHWFLGGSFYLSNFSSVFYSTPQNQPYSVFSALGYRSQLIRGYETKVIEGPQFFLNKTTLKKRIF